MSLAELQDIAAGKWDEFDSPVKARILIGNGTCGKAAGAAEAMTAAQAFLEKEDLAAKIYGVGCLGLCFAEPLVELSKPGAPRILYGNVNPDTVADLLHAYFKTNDPCADRAVAIMAGGPVAGIPDFDKHPMLKGQVRIALRNCGVIDPESMDHYIARGGYVGLQNALGIDPADVIEKVRKSGLRGRGGAGFPTGTKWEFCHRSVSDRKYIICNADEGDPGAFMDRSVIESDPHSVLEGMAIAAYAIGASHGYIYVRAEYPLAIDRLRKAIAQAEAAGLLGDDILGSGFCLHIKLKVGAGAFVCGEETALMASIEGKRGMPRSRPPFPAQSGLHGKPTNINNVETLANVGPILANGSEWFAQYGTEKSKGAKTFALTGKITRTGLIEVPLGTTLHDIVDGIGGGTPDGKKMKAVQTGGPSGGCIPAALFNLPVDYERLAEAGAIMGSGGMVVMDEDTCMADIARYFIEFTQSESCGKCVPCRLGTRQMLGILNRITSGQGKPDDIQLLHEIGSAVKDGSLCGLGQTAPNPVLSTIRYFEAEYRAHIDDRKCPAGACRSLLTYHVNPEKCTRCGVCFKNCPANAIRWEKKQLAEIDQEKCTRCGICKSVCKFGAVVTE